MVGGPLNTRCLRSFTGAGLGEGWSDTIAVYLSRKSDNTRNDDAAVGSYATNRNLGVREFAYSSDTGRNPLSFSSLNTVQGPHAVGTVWAQMLFEMYWNLVDAKGFSDNWYDATQEVGNIMALQLVIGGMKFVSCNPSFSEARDGILAADQAFYNGANKCLIWKAFAKRGLGVDSKETNDQFTNGSGVAEGC